MLLFTFDFEVSGTGQSVFMFTDPDILSEGQIVLSDTTLLDDLFGTSLMGINSVPVPGALWLFLSGMMGIIGFHRSKSK